MGKLTKIKHNVYTYQTKMRLLEFSFLDGKFGYYDGPSNTTARNHEGGGGVFKLEQFDSLSNLRKEYPEFYPQLKQMVEDYKKTLNE